MSVEREPERRLTARMMAAIRDEYREVLDAACRAADEVGASRRRTVARLKRELQRIAQRDFFPPLEREQAHAAVMRLAAEQESADA